MANIIQIDSKTWAVNDDFVRFFILEGNSKVLVIDSGASTRGGKCRELVMEALGNTDKPIELINTHSDGDHTAGNADFDYCYMHEADIPGYVFRAENPDALKATVRPVKDGDLFDLGGRLISIAEIPGHTPGSIALIDLTNRILFPGDTVSDADIFMFDPRRNIERYIESLMRLKTLTDSFDKIYPSHGTFEVPVNQIDVLIDYATSITLGGATAKFLNMFGNDILHYKFEKAGFFCDMPIERAVTTEEMRKSDAWTIENLASSEELMLRAGQSILDATIDAQGLGDTVKEPVAVVAGKGNNAGDGYVVAMLLEEMGIKADIYLLYPDSFSTDGRFYFDKCAEKNLNINTFADDTSLKSYATIIEGVFGTGFRGTPEGIAAKGIEAINEARRNGAYVVSCDINSGINGDTGEGEIYVESDLTVSIGSFKRGHFMGKSLKAVGSIVNKDIGIVIGQY